MKKILFVSTDYPPLVGTNTQRVQSFVRHLIAMGYECSVCTRSIEDLESVSLPELARIPKEACVIRVDDPEPFVARARRQRAAVKLAEQNQGEDKNQSVVSQSAATGLDARPRGGGAFLRMASHGLKWLLRMFAYQPDVFRLWAAHAARVIRADRDWTHGVLITSSPSYSSHLAGLSIKRKLGTPWIADFRDLWVGRPFRSIASPFHRWWDQWQEARVVAACDAIVLASPAWVSTFIARYGPAVARKITVITNGYEAQLIDNAAQAARAAQLQGATSSEESGCIRFVLTGSMHVGESPLPMINALGLLAVRAPELACRARLTFIGNTDGHGTELEKAVHRHHLRDQVEFLGPRSNQECLVAQMKADCLMLFSAKEHADTLRGKSFEYMASGKPILACIPVGGVQDQMLQGAGTAIVVEHADEHALSHVLERILRDGPPKLEPDWAYIERFERGQLTKQLADVIALVQVKGGQQ